MYKYHVIDFDSFLDIFDDIMDEVARTQNAAKEEAKQKVDKPTHTCHCNCQKKIPEIKNIIFNDPVTVVFWNDGTKTIVKASNGDKFSKELGIVYSVFKKLYGPNTSAAINKMLAKSQDQADIKAAKQAKKKQANNQNNA